MTELAWLGWVGWAGWWAGVVDSARPTDRATDRPPTDRPSATDPTDPTDQPDWPITADRPTVSMVETVRVGRLVGGDRPTDRGHGRDRTRGSLGGWVG